MTGPCRDCGYPTESIVYIGSERRSAHPCIWRTDFLCAACGLAVRTESLNEKETLSQASMVSEASGDAGVRISQDRSKDRTLVPAMSVKATI